MDMLVGLTLAASPFALIAALLAVTARRQHRRHAEVARQIALTDALHARVGAVVAPVVRLRGRVWQVDVAVPAEQPALAAAIVRTMDEVFGRVACELRLRRPRSTASAAAPRPAGATRESLSWT